VRNLRKF